MRLLTLTIFLGLYVSAASAGMFTKGYVIGEGSAPLSYSSDPWLESKEQADRQAGQKCGGEETTRVGDYELSSKPYFGGQVGFARAEYGCGDYVSDY